MAFKQRKTSPSYTNKYYKHTSAGGYNSCLRIKGSSVLPNCVGYAWGRVYEITKRKPKLSRGNAETWWVYKDGYKRGRTPKVGAVVVWAMGSSTTGRDGYGHVAVVEQINSNGTFVVSQSGYNNRKRFYRTTIPRSGYLRGYRLLGYIYPPSVTSTVSRPTSYPYKKGRVYTLRVNLKVRTGAGTKYRWKKRTEITADGRKHAKSGKYAVLKKGTKVTCTDVKRVGSEYWIQTPSGWICARKGNRVYVS